MGSTQSCNTSTLSSVLSTDCDVAGGQLSLSHVSSNCLKCINYTGCICLTFSTVSFLMLFKLLCCLPLVLATGWGCGWRSAMHAFVFAFKFCFGFSSFGTWAAFGFALALLSSNGSEATGCVVGGQRCARESSQTTLDTPLVASGLPLWTKPGTARPACQSVTIHICVSKSQSLEISVLWREKTKVSNW